MINKEEFLKTCNLTEDDLTAARISWEELTEIYEDYMSKTKLFRHLGKEFVDEYIYDIERAGIHSFFTGRTGSIFISSSLRCLKMIRTII